ncbi:TonB-dependent receptor [Myxococcota bacterium]|nr:TonB-dependent receptor [Myxococcota bacterium]
MSPALAQDPPASTPTDAQTIRAKVEYPKLVKFVPAPYPEAARKEKREGVVFLSVEIDETGRVVSVKVVRSVAPDLDEAAVAAVTQFEFTPARLDGKPISVTVPLSYPFKLKEAGKPEDNGDPKRPVEATPPSYTPDPVEKPREYTGRLKGQLWRYGQRTRVTDATIVVTSTTALPEVGQVQKRVFGNDNGSFAVKGLPPGAYEVIVEAPGFFVQRRTISVDTGERELEFFLKATGDPVYITIISGRAVAREVTRYAVRLDEILNIPGTQGDALRSIQNMPGVARAPFGLGLIVVRGSAPRDTRIFFEGFEIPQLFHFFGLTSVINSDLLSKIEFVPGNFSARYGRAMGGIIDVSVRKAKTDGWHGYLDMDLWDTSALVEGPVGKGGIALSVRRSYIDSVLRLIPGMEIAPVYYDYQALFDYPILGGDFKLMSFGADDRIMFLEKGETPYITQSHKLTAQYRKRFGEDRLFASAGVALFNLSFLSDDQTFRLSLETRQAEWRLEYLHQFNSKLSATAGFDGNWASGLFSLSTRFGGNREGSDEGDINNPFGDKKFEFDGIILANSFFTEGNWHPDKRWTVIPGLRLDLVRVGETDIMMFDPRLTVRYAVKPDKLCINAGVGLYSQEMEIQEVYRDFMGNPRLSANRSLHTTIGTTIKPVPSLSIESAVFYKHLWDLVTESDRVLMLEGEQVRENLANQGYGRVYGMELLVKKESDALCPPFLGMNKCFGWVSYTLSRSERKESDAIDWHVFTFDQTHILTVLFSGQWRNGWQAGFRFRLSTGIPLTPNIGGIYDSDSNRYQGVQGALNSERLPLFHQLDLRVDKKIEFQRWSLTFYVDVQNVYYNKATEFIDYNFNYTKRRTIEGLPIFPSFGVKGEF